MNIVQYYTLKDWQAWWDQYTDLPVTWAQDAKGQTTEAFQLAAVGTKIIVDRDGRIVYRSVGVTGYEALKAAVEAAL